MNAIRTGVGLGVLALAAAAALAQDAGDGQAPSEPAAGAEQRGREPAAEVPPVEDDVFIPTEEIPADEEVTFPVDI